ncbi:phytanoyl-CoA dioxygenase family protein [Roseomonas sp. BN140053]|uniref:phytanoyl-CoA dioxygenase family protein n=1 Tax=Roseomonas sp. BN140053 TaxID=3391898 RepID=UPI0039ED6031
MTQYAAVSASRLAPAPSTANRWPEPARTDDAAARSRTTRVAAPGLSVLLRGLRWLLLPWYAGQVLTGRKVFSGNPILGSERLNRRGLHLWRVRLAGRLAAWRRKRLAHLVSPEDRAAFARDGFVEVPELLPPAAFEALAQHLGTLVAEAREMREGGAVTRRIPVTPALLRRVPELRPLLDSPRWRGLTRYVGAFDTEPVTYVQAILANASGEEDPQTQLHMDTFHPTMKAWFFLHPVPDSEGPLTYVAGSHTLGRRRLAWQRARSVLACRGPNKGGAFRLSASALPQLGWAPPRRFAVAGNTLVVADTSGFHARAASPRPSLRVEIYALSRPNPFLPVLRPPLDWFPVLARRQVPLQYWLQDRLSRLGLMRPVWRKAGAISPAAPVSRAFGDPG